MATAKLRDPYGTDAAPEDPYWGDTADGGQLIDYMNGLTPMGMEKQPKGIPSMDSPYGVGDKEAQYDPSQGPETPQASLYTTPTLRDPIAINYAKPDPFQYRPMAGFDDIMGTLKDIYSNGGKFNQQAVTARTSNAADTLNRFKKSQSESDRAALAARGLVGDGPEQTAYGRLGSDIADRYSNAVTDIFANESQLADQRMIQALAQAVGISTADAANYVNQFNADTSRQLGFANVNLGHESNAIGQNNAYNDNQLALGRLGLDNLLGQGNLALGNMKAQNDFNLGRGQQYNDLYKIILDSAGGDQDRITALINTLMNGANISAGGYRG